MLWYTASVRLLLAIAVSLSFLAGQACGDGVGFYVPAQPQEEMEFMSKLDVRCGLHVEGSSVAAKNTADCGPGQCIQQGNEEPQSAAIADARADAVIPDSPVAVRPVPAHLITYAFQDDDVSRTARPVSQVRRE